jgi:hypothetical protein
MRMCLITCSPIHHLFQKTGKAEGSFSGERYTATVQALLPFAAWNSTAADGLGTLCGCTKTGMMSAGRQPNGFRDCDSASYTSPIFGEVFLSWESSQGNYNRVLVRR